MSFQIYQGDCFEPLERVHSVDHAIFDPPYSKHVHANVKTGTCNPAKHKMSHTVDLGFDSIDVAWMEKMSGHLFRVVRRWCLVFCDVESSHLWREALTSVGFDYVRTGAWIRPGAPQISGDRPGPGFDAVVICHKPGRKHWNGGGVGAVWHHGTLHPCRPCGTNNTREHPTQKPLPLMVELVSLFSDPGDTILDPTMGAGTTGVAAVRLGRSFVGMEKIEKHFLAAKTRLEAETIGSDAVSFRAGQLPMFGGG